MSRSTLFERASSEPSLYWHKSTISALGKARRSASTKLDSRKVTSTSLSWLLVAADAEPDGDCFASVTAADSDGQINGAVL
eukprot:scaffold299708_cov32-Tisochrysis_lutea.AAC.3